MENVLEACVQLPSLSGEPPVLRQYIAESARKIFDAAVAGMMVRDGESFLPGAVCTAVDESAGKKALLEHVRSFATQAIEQKRLLNFRFSYRSPDGEAIYHGLAQPMVTTGTAAVLLAVRSSVFSPTEVSAFSVLGNIARLALDNSELTGLYSAQKHDLNQLLDISSELGATAQLESFLPRFVVRAADFLGFSRAFVALMDSGVCRLRWGASKGTVSRLEIDVSVLAKRPIESRTPHICEDISQLPAAEKAQLLRWESGPKQYLGIPLLTGDGRPLGVLGLMDKKEQVAHFSGRCSPCPRAWC